MRIAAELDEIAALAAQASAGDERAFRRLVDASHRTVYRLAFRLLGDAAAAEDVVQETFLRTWQGLPALRDPQAALGWICRIARNVARDRQRAQYRRPATSLDVPRNEDQEPLRDRLAHPDPGPEDRLGSAELGRLVQEALAGLKEKHRLVLTLREIDDMSYEEIAAALGCRLGTVESRLFRARAALARRLRALAREMGTPIPAVVSTAGTATPPSSEEAKEEDPS